MISRHPDRLPSRPAEQHQLGLLRRTSARRSGPLNERDLRDMRRAELHSTPRCIVRVASPTDASKKPTCSMTAMSWSQGRSTRGSSLVPPRKNLALAGRSVDFSSVRISRRVGKSYRPSTCDGPILPQYLEWVWVSVSFSIALRAVSPVLLITNGQRSSPLLMRACVSGHPKFREAGSTSPRPPDATSSPALRHARMLSALHGRKDLVARIDADLAAHGEIEGEDRGLDPESAGI
jgi:hypothetical protein